MFNKFLITILFFHLSVLSSSTLYANTDVTRPTEWGDLIQKEYNFYQVSPFVFRSEQPSKNIIPLLKQHNIDVVINLRVSNKDKKVFQDTQTKLVHIPVNTWSMSKEDLLKVMQSIQEAKQSNQKVLIHCYHGSDRTGASVAMYRIIFEN